MCVQIKQTIYIDKDIHDVYAQKRAEKGRHVQSALSITGLSIPYRTSPIIIHADDLMPNSPPPADWQVCMV